MWMKPIAAGVVSAVLVGVLAGPVGARASVGASPARVDVVAAFYPLAEAVRQVGGRYVHVVDVTPAGVEPHDLELTTDQVDRIQDARLVVVLGDDFQPALEKAARDRDGATLVVVDHLRSETNDDPHVWLDPARMRDIVDAVQAALTKVAPKHAKVFALRAARFDAQLSRLDVEFSVGLARCERRLLVTAHEAFGYLASAYALSQRGVAGLSPDAEPDPKRLAELADLARDEGVTTIFTEELVPPKVAETLAREAGGLKTEVLNPLEGLTDEQRARGDGYVSVMRDNLEKLRTALGCS